MKKICVVSGTRADYGLLYWTMKEIQNDPELELQVIATCMHLDPKFGDTWKHFEKDGFPISKKVSLGELGDSRSSIVDQVSVAVKGMFEAFQDLRPDLIVILGDRYEMLASAEAAMFAGIPIAHIHGGEITEGAFDDFIRHSITKMSSFHFTSTESYRKRVIQMGENPSRVLNVGAVGLENLTRLKLLNKQELEESLKFKFKEVNFLITYHPVTAANEDATDSLLQTLEDYSHAGIVITLPNSDPGHDHIIKKFSSFASGKSNVFITPSLGSLRYLSVMKLSNAVIGNSSSGIIEAPFLGVPTLNIGIRQKGRIHADSVVDCSISEIKKKLDEILSKSFSKSDLYGDGYSAAKIVEFIKNEKLTVKTGFYDI